MRYAMKKMLQKSNTGIRSTGIAKTAQPWDFFPGRTVLSQAAVPVNPGKQHRSANPLRHGQVMADFPSSSTPVSRSVPLCSSASGVYPGRAGTVNPSSSPCLLTPVSSRASARPAPVPIPNADSWRSGFTLVEMLVVMAILVVMMAAVGEIFQTAGHTVRLGQATLQMMAGVRTVEAQLNHDLAHINPNGYLIIRGSYFAPYWASPGYANTSVSAQTYPNWYGDTANSATPPVVDGTNYQVGDQVYYDKAYYTCVKANSAGGATSPGSSVDWAAIAVAGYAPPWQDDQLTFLANGTFHDRTGSNGSGGLSPFMDNLTSNAAAVWYGQLFMEPVPGATGSPYPQPNQATLLPLGTPPTGATAGNFVFGRHVTLLAPGTSATSVGTTPGYAAFSDINYANLYAMTVPLQGAVLAYKGESRNAVITSSRVDTAIISPTQIEQALIGQTPTAIGDAYCYRFCALPAPAAGTDVTGGDAGLVNGYFRMTPILLQGMPSFTVQWTDGSSSSITGTLNWYGLGNPSGNANVEVTTDTYDQYVAVFDAATRRLGYWPKALKITFTVTDSHNLLQGGRVITEVVRLPQ